MPMNFISSSACPGPSAFGERSRNTGTPGWTNELLKKLGNGFKSLSLLLGVLFVNGCSDPVQYMGSSYSTGLLCQQGCRIVTVAKEKLSPNNKTQIRSFSRKYHRKGRVYISSCHPGTPLNSMERFILGDIARVIHHSGYEARWVSRPVWTVQHIAARRSCFILIGGKLEIVPPRKPRPQVLNALNDFDNLGFSNEYNLAIMVADPWDLIAPGTSITVFTQQFEKDYDDHEKGIPEKLDIELTT